MPMMKMLLVMMRMIDGDDDESVIRGE